MGSCTDRETARADVNRLFEVRAFTDRGLSKIANFLRTPSLRDLRRLLPCRNVSFHKQSDRDLEWQVSPGLEKRRTRAAAAETPRDVCAQLHLGSPKAKAASERMDRNSQETGSAGINGKFRNHGTLSPASRKDFSHAQLVVAGFPPRPDGCSGFPTTRRHKRSGAGRSPRARIR